MGRKSLIDNDQLLERLSETFRDNGFDGASLARLSEAAGLKRASLYHRFPGGKEQMASESFQWRMDQLTADVAMDLSAHSPARERFRALSVTLRSYFDDGASACLLNRMTGSEDALRQFSDPVTRVFHGLRDAISAVLVETGVKEDEARMRAEDALMMIQGALVYSQATQQSEAFARVMDTLPERLMTPSNIA